MSLISTKLRNSAKGQQCTLRTAVCNNDPETTVLAHAPSIYSGMGCKSDDTFAAFGCSACHKALDEHELPIMDELKAWMQGIAETQRYWLEKGLLIPAQSDVRPSGKPKKRHTGKIPQRKDHVWPKREIQSRPFRKKEAAR